MGVSGNDYTGLQLTHSPGLGIIWTGCLLLMIGLFLIFFMFHRQFYLVIRRKNREADIEVSGSGSRPALFKAQRDALIRDLERIISRK